MVGVKSSLAQVCTTTSGVVCGHPMAAIAGTFDEDVRRIKDIMSSRMNRKETTVEFVRIGQRVAKVVSSSGHAVVNLEPWQASPHQEYAWHTPGITVAEDGSIASVVSAFHCLFRGWKVDRAVAIDVFKMIVVLFNELPAPPKKIWTAKNLNGTLSRIRKDFLGRLLIYMQLEYDDKTENPVVNARSLKKQSGLCRICGSRDLTKLVCMFDRGTTCKPCYDKWRGVKTVWKNMIPRGYFDTAVPSRAILKGSAMAMRKIGKDTDVSYLDAILKMYDVYDLRDLYGFCALPPSCRSLLGRRHCQIVGLAAFFQPWNYPWCDGGMKPLRKFDSNTVFSVFRKTPLRANALIKLSECTSAYGRVDISTMRAYSRAKIPPGRVDSTVFTRTLSEDGCAPGECHLFVAVPDLGVLVTVELLQVLGALQHGTLEIKICLTAPDAPVRDTAAETATLDRIFVDTVNSCRVPNPAKLDAAHDVSFEMLSWVAGMMAKPDLCTPPYVIELRGSYTLAARRRCVAGAEPFIYGDAFEQLVDVGIAKVVPNITVELDPAYSVVSVPAQHADDAQREIEAFTSAEWPPVIPGRRHGADFVGIADIANVAAKFPELCARPPEDTYPPPSEDHAAAKRRT